MALTRDVFKELEEYIDSYLSKDDSICLDKETSYLSIPDLQEQEQEIEEAENMEEYVKRNKKTTFRDLLMSYIDERGLVDAQVYKKAGLDRRHFSKIRSDQNYRPSKKTVLSLCLALELDEEKTGELLGSSGYVLSDSNTFDLIIRFCLEKEIYKLYDVNLALDHFGLEPLN